MGRFTITPSCFIKEYILITSLIFLIGFTTLTCTTNKKLQVIGSVLISNDVINIKMSTVGNSDEDYSLNVDTTLILEDVLLKNNGNTIELSTQNGLLNIPDAIQNESFSYELNVASVNEIFIYNIHSDPIKISNKNYKLASSEEVSTIAFFIALANTLKKKSNFTTIYDFSKSRTTSELDTIASISNNAIKKYNSIVNEGIQDVTIYLFENDKYNISYASEGSKIKFVYYDNARYLHSTLSHEIAHSIFNFGRSGNDTPDAFLNESFAEFFSWLYAKEYFGNQTYFEIVEKHRNLSNRMKYSILDVSSKNNFSINQSILYDRGPYLISQIYEEMGEENFNLFINEFLILKPSKIEEFLKFLSRFDDFESIKSLINDLE